MATATTMTMAAVVEEPMLSRLDRLDNIVRQLEEIRGGGGSYTNRSPAKSSCASSGTLTSVEDHHSSLDFSPRSLEKHCRPIDDVIIETEMKGTLIERLVQVEERVLKICLTMEKELEMAEKEKEKKKQKVVEEAEERLTPIMLTTTPTSEKSKKKKGLKELVKSCVKGGKGKQLHKSS